ncbi:MAG: EF-hand domain-containing protein [Gimesia sp.]
MRFTHFLSVCTTLLAVCATTLVTAQPPKQGDRGDRPEQRDRGERGNRDGGPQRDRRGGPGGRPDFMQMLPVIAALDTNKDGEISKEEIENATASLKKLDKDKNGKLTRDELLPSFGRRGGDRRGPGGAGGPSGSGGREGDRRGPGNRSAFSVDGFIENMMKNDKNKDGKLTKEELPERMQSMFSRIDTNKDNEVDKAELKKMAENFNSRSRSGGRDRGSRDSGKNRPKRPESEK